MSNWMPAKFSRSDNHAEKAVSSMSNRFAYGKSTVHIMIYPMIF